jgi:hypothetical protein
MKTWVIVLIVVGSVAVLAGGAFATVKLLGKKKVKAAKTFDESSDEASEESESNN